MRTNRRILTDLEKILQEAEELGARMRYEERVCRAEQEDRQRLGLHGDEAIAHYNEWMRAHGLTHLMVTD